MTTTLAPVELWRTMPGWGIAADLTPPELINARLLKGLQKMIVAGLVLLLVACLGGYILAGRALSAETEAADGMQAQTAVLQSEAGEYSGVTRIQGSVIQVQTQIATLMGGDVDLVKLMGQFRSALPAKMTIDHVSVLISLAGVAEPVPGSGLDTSGQAHIGDVTITGSGPTTVLVSSYIEKLMTLQGVTDVVPTSNAITKSGVAFTVTLGLTDELLSHRYDLDTPGGK